MWPSIQAWVSLGWLSVHFWLMDAQRCSKLSVLCYGIRNKLLNIVPCRIGSQKLYNPVVETLRAPLPPPGPDQPWNLVHVLLFGGLVLPVFPLANYVPGGLCHIRKESGFIVNPWMHRKGFPDRVILAAFGWKGITQDFPAIHLGLAFTECF